MPALGAVAGGIGKAASAVGSVAGKIGGAVKGIRNSIVDYANRETELDQQIRQNREDEQSDRIQRAMDDAAGKNPLRENVELDRIKHLNKFLRS
jgi:hypothetical protein